jgi:hypothetical protein
MVGAHDVVGRVTMTLLFLMTSALYVMVQEYVQLAAEHQNVMCALVQV